METQAIHPYDAPASGESAQRSLFRSLRFWLPACICAVALAAVPIAFILGAVLGNTQIYREFSERQQNRIENYLSQHPETFSRISVGHASNGWAYAYGTVSSQSDYELLNAKLGEMFGDELAKRMMNSVEIDNAN